MRICREGYLYLSIYLGRCRDDIDAINTDINIDMYDMYVDTSHVKNIKFKVGICKFTKTSFTSRMLYYLQYSYKLTLQS